MKMRSKGGLVYLVESLGCLLKGGKKIYEIRNLKSGDLKDAGNA